MPQTVLNFPITTTPSEIKLPEGTTSEGFVAVCTLNDIPVSWRKQPTESSAKSVLYPDVHIPFRFRSNDGAVLFWASTVSGTGTLEMEVWLGENDYINASAFGEQVVKNYVLENGEYVLENGEHVIET